VLRAEDGTKIVCPNSGITGGVIKVIKVAAVPAQPAVEAKAGRA
jgi:hypothetical protein